MEDDIFICFSPSASDTSIFISLWKPVFAFDKMSFKMSLSFFH